MQPLWFSSSHYQRQSPWQLSDVCSVDQAVTRSTSPPYLSLGQPGSGKQSKDSPKTRQEVDRTSSAIKDEQQSPQSSNAVKDQATGAELDIEELPGGKEI
jgi:hypothetical protein